MSPGPQAELSRVCDPCHATCPASQEAWFRVSLNTGQGRDTVRTLEKDTVSVWSLDCPSHVAGTVLPALLPHLMCRPGSGARAPSPSSSGHCDQGLQSMALSRGCPQAALLAPGSGESEPPPRQHCRERGRRQAAPGDRPLPGPEPLQLRDRGPDTHWAEPPWTAPHGLPAGALTWGGTGEKGQQEQEGPHAAGLQALGSEEAANTHTHRSRREHLPSEAGQRGGHVHALWLRPTQPGVSTQPPVPAGLVLQPLQGATQVRAQSRGHPDSRVRTLGQQERASLDLHVCTRVLTVCLNRVICSCATWV